MSSSLRVNTIVPSTGTNVAIGTANGTVTFTDSVNFVLGTGSSIFSPASNTLTFGTNDAERLRITSDGKLGIKVTSPGCQTGGIHAVHDATEGTPSFTGGEVGIFQRNYNSAQGCEIGIIGGSNSSSRINFGDKDDADIGIISYSHNDNSMRFIASAAERLRITGIGSVGIGQNNPDTLLHLTKTNADPYNTPVTLLKLHNGGGNQGSTSRLEFKTGAATCYIENKIGGPNSGSGADLVFATPSSGTVGTERMRIHSDGVIQTSNHAECLAFQNGQSVTGGDASTHELGVSTFNFNRGGFTISSNNLIVPKTGMYRCFMRFESMITNSGYTIRAISCNPRVNGTVSGTYTSHWHSVTPGPSSNTHYSFTDQYYLNLNANDAIDGLMTWYPYASRTQNFDLSISLFYIG